MSEIVVEPEIVVEHTPFGEFRQSGRMVYPGYRGECNIFRHNLASYREGVTWRKSGAERDNSFNLDVERYISWDVKTYALYPMTYSAMVSCKYPSPRWLWQNKQASGPTKEEFEETITNLPGFVLDPEITLERDDLLLYRNAALGVIASWKSTKGEVRVGVVHDEPVGSLEHLTQAIIPYVVRTFNILNPSRQLEQVIVDRVVDLARKADLVPQLRAQ